MRIDITPGRGRISVGPPGGPTETIPASVTVTITDTFPYDVEARLEWSPTVGKLAVRKVCCTGACPAETTSRPPASPAWHYADTIQAALETEYLGGTSWPGLLDKHNEHDPLAVDALIYLLAVAFQSPKPTATVALARGLSPASGPKRVLAARKAGLLPETEPGKPADVTDGRVSIWDPEIGKYSVVDACAVDGKVTLAPRRPIGDQRVPSFERIASAIAWFRDRDEHVAAQVRLITQQPGRDGSAQPLQTDSVVMAHDERGHIIDTNLGALCGQQS